MRWRCCDASQPCSLRKASAKCQAATAGLRDMYSQHFYARRGCHWPYNRKPSTCTANGGQAYTLHNRQSQKSRRYDHGRHSCRFSINDAGHCDNKCLAVRLERLSEQTLQYPDVLAGLCSRGLPAWRLGWDPRSATTEKFDTTTTVASTLAKCNLQTHTVQQVLVPQHTHFFFSPPP